MFFSRNHLRCDYPVGRPNRFDDNHRLQTRPFRERREGRKVRYGPDSPSYRAAVRVIEGIKEILGVTPRYRASENELENEGWSG
jgi:hypothetical protein